MTAIKSKVAFLYTVCVVGNHQNFNLRKKKKGVGKEHRPSVPNMYFI